MSRNSSGAGTTSRFVLLIVLFLTGSDFMLGDLLTRYTDPNSMQFGCQLAAGVDPNLNRPSNFRAMGTEAYLRCLTDYAGGWIRLGAPLVGATLLALLAIGYYLVLPRWKSRAGRAVPIARADPDGALRAALDDLAARSELRRTPRCVVNMSAKHANALVFGRPGRYTVLLDLPLLAVFTLDRPAFDAILLHEFAHIRNRDVDVTYLTVAVWRVFLVAVLLPFAVVEGWKAATGALAARPSLYWQGEAPDLARSVALAAFIVLLMHLATADILRVREVCADIDAVGRGADRRYWTSSRSAVSQSGRAGPALTRIAHAVRAALRRHPDWETRVAAVASPSTPFAVRATTMFLTGASAQILGYFLDQFPGSAPYLARFSWLQDAGVWPTAALVTAVAGLAVHREAVRSVRAGRPAPSGLRAGLWLGLGQLLGELLVSQSMHAEWLPAFPQVLVLLLPVLVPAGILWWTAGCAAIWAGLPHGMRSRTRTAVLLTVTGLAFAWWYTWWQEAGLGYASGSVYGSAYAYETMYAGFPHSPTMDVIAALTDPVVSLNLNRWSIWLTAALWLIPLAGLARSAARREPGGRGAPVLWGAASGVGATAGILAVTASAHEWIWHTSGSPFQSVVVYAAWVFGILLCAALSAAVTASLVTHGAAAPAMAAACVATAVGLAAAFLVWGTDGCVAPLALLASSCDVAGSLDWTVPRFLLADLLRGAGLLTIVAASAAAVVSRLWGPGPGRPGAAEGASPAAVRSPRRRAPLVWALGTCVTVLSTCGFAFFDASGEAGGGSRVSDGVVATAPVGRAVLTQQIRAWAHFGGQHLLGDYSTALDAFIQSVNGNEIDHARARRACLAMEAWARRAQAYFPLPDSQQPAWSASLALTARGARECVSALATSNDQVLVAGASDLDDASSAVARITEQLAQESHG